ncbi:MAG: polysaccharide deacetylase family protein [Chloroflexi bacterium]|nr:polysaccharide deacetylase family protein [Chloroflexota bacterium]
MRWSAVFLVALWLVWHPASAAADPEDWVLADGRFFTQGGGYVVSDASGQPFWSAFQALGGSPGLGYPISRRFAWQGRSVQVFQRGVLAYDPLARAVEPLDLLDALSALGYDDALAAQHQVPRVARLAGDELDRPWPERCVPCRRLVHLGSGDGLPRSALVAERLSWLATAPALHAFYTATPGAARLLGLPTSFPQAFGAHVNVRFQRGVLRLARVDAAGAPPSSPVLAPAGELARALGAFGAGGQWATEPARPPQPAPAVVRQVGPPPSPAAAGGARPRASPAPAPAASVAPPAAPARPRAEAPPLAGPVVRGNPVTGVVALTFDLGIPSAGALESVLDTLERAGVRSTFFITGYWAEAQPDLLRRIVAAGHELANHSYSHPNLTQVDPARARWEIEHTERIAQALVGQTTQPYFRPPFGAYNRQVLELVEGLGYRIVMWTLDSADWRPESTAATIAQRVGGRTDPGDIAVMHGYVPKTAQALPAILERLAARGLRAGTLGDVMR